MTTGVTTILATISFTGDSEGEDEADGVSDGDVLSGDDGDEDLVVRSLAKDSITQEEEDEFNKEFAKLLVDQGDSKKSDRKVNIPVFDTAIPLMRRSRPVGGARGPAAADEEPVQDGSDDVSASSMKFMLLTKKGNKPQVRRQPA
jgi:regulator of nonsense transcripts 2